MLDIEQPPQPNSDGAWWLMSDNGTNPYDPNHLHPAANAFSLREWVEKWIERFESDSGGIKPILYTSSSFLGSFFPNGPLTYYAVDANGRLKHDQDGNIIPDGSVDIWVAEYGTNTPGFNPRQMLTHWPSTNDSSGNPIWPMH